MQVFQRIHDTLLYKEQLISTSQVHSPPSLPPLSTLQLVHDADYIRAFTSGTLPPAIKRRIGFGEVVSDPILIQRTLSEVAGTILTAQLALSHGMAVNCAGGTHHAFRHSGSGFCIVNDIAIAIEVMLKIDKSIQRALVVDCDVHQGDGTSSLFPHRHHDVFTLDIHAANNFPARKQQSSLDIGLPDGTDDDTYLSVLANALTSVLTDFKPDIVIYDAGVDPHQDDALGRLSLTDDGLYRRDMLVLDTCVAHGVAVAGLVGGGYHHDLDVLADRHCYLHRAALQLFPTIKRLM